MVHVSTLEHQTCMAPPAGVSEQSLQSLAPGYGVLGEIIRLFV